MQQPGRHLQINAAWYRSMSPVRSHRRTFRQAVEAVLLAIGQSVPGSVLQLEHYCQQECWKSFRCPLVDLQSRSVALGKCKQLQTGCLWPVIFLLTILLLLLTICVMSHRATAKQSTQAQQRPDLLLADLDFAVLLLCPRPNSCATSCASCSA